MNTINAVQRDELNHFFVNTFNTIIAMEERFVLREDILGISVKELHILEAINELKENATMTKVAEWLSITVGALTTAVSVLVRKGHVIRQNDEHDRRIVRLKLTETAIAAEAKHHKFHSRMIDSISEALNDKSTEVLIESLKALGVFFDKYRARIINEPNEAMQ